MFYCILLKGKNKLAFDSYFKSYEMRQRLYQDADHPDLADSLFNLAAINEYLGDVSHSLTLSVAAKEMRERLYRTTEENGTNDHPDLATSLDAIGHCRYLLRDYKQALEYHQKAYEMRKRVFGEDNNGRSPASIHLDFAQSYTNLSYVYEKLFDYRKALEYDLKCLELRRANLPGTHSDVAVSLESVAYSYEKCGNFEMALKYRRECLEMRESVYNREDHPDVANALNDLGIAYENLRDFKNALKYKQSSLEMRKRIYKGIKKYKITLKSCK